MGKRKQSRGELVGSFLRAQRGEDSSRTIPYWSKRWGVSENLIFKWQAGTRVISPERSDVWKDLPFGRDEYFESPA
jgi:hypothetical protein